MDRFEDELREALHRVEPPVGFAERVASRALPAGKTGGRLWNWRFATVALSLLVLLIAGVHTDGQRRQRIAGEKIKQQLLLALRITQSKLEAVEARIVENQR